MTTQSAPERPRSLSQRMLVFAFGVTAYGLGVGTLLVLIAIMLGLRSFTGGPLGKLSLGPALGVDVALLVAFGLQHSVMARPSFKEKWTRIVPVEAERSAYLVATFLVLAPLILFWQPMPSVVWSVESPALRWLVIGLGLTGWAYLLIASFAIDHSHLFGLRQVYQALHDRPLTQSLRSAPHHDRDPNRHLVDADHDRGSSGVRTRRQHLHLCWRPLRGAHPAPRAGGGLPGILRASPLRRADVRGCASLQGALTILSITTP